MFDLVVVGSGYGGAIVAARLAPHCKVLLVERGKRWRSGDFPRTITQLASSYIHKRNKLGLWAMRFGDGTGNAFASAYGGASVVNYGITARPEDHVFKSWPVSAFQWNPYFERALSVLRPTANPVADQLADKKFLDLVEPGRRVDLVNTINWDQCTQCGHCCPGCNLEAKRSLDTNYLRMAEEAGVTLALERSVVGFAQNRSGGWSIRLRDTDGKNDVETVHAKDLVLSAGTFGTLDLLHKEREHLPLSPLFGERMTVNGDGAAFLYNMPESVSGHHGAPITTSVRIPFVDAQNQERTLMVMSGRIPFSMMHGPAMVMATLANALPGHVAGRGRRDAMAQRALRRLRDLWSVTSTGAMSHTFMFKVDAEDSSRGRASFDRLGRSAIDWPNYSDEPIIRFSRQRLHAWAEQVGANLVEEVGSWPFAKNFGVHPLGGCRMGEDVSDGVVDEYCRVFKQDGEVYPGLRVVDASAIASSLGVPSSLMVSAIAERAAEHMLSELGASN